MSKDVEEEIYFFVVAAACLVLALFYGADKLNAHDLRDLEVQVRASNELHEAIARVKNRDRDRDRGSFEWRTDGEIVTTAPYKTTPTPTLRFDSHAETDPALVLTDGEPGKTRAADDYDYRYVYVSLRKGQGRGIRIDRQTGEVSWCDGIVVWSYKPPCRRMEVEVH